MGFPSPIVTSVSQEILFLSETIAVEAARSRVLLLKAMSLFSEFIETSFIQLFEFNSVIY